MKRFSLVLLSLVLAAAAVTAAPRLAAASADAKPAPDAAALRALLARGEFAELTRVFDSLQAAAEKDPQRETQVVMAFDAFRVEDPAVEPALARWASARPKHWAPYAARASHLSHLAWKSRGAALAKDTAPGKFEMQRYFFEKLRPDLEKALALGPKVAVTWSVAVGVAMAEGRTEDCLNVLDRALEKIPATYEVRSRAIQCAHPRWGGSYEEMDRIAEGSSAHLAANPDLRFLPSEVDEEKAEDARRARNFVEAIRYYTRSIQRAERPSHYLARGQLWMTMNQLDDARRDFDRSIEMRPTAEALLERAMLRIKPAAAPAEEIHGAADDLVRAAALAPDDRKVRSFRSMVSSIVMSHARRASDAGDAVAAFGYCEAALRLDEGNGEARVVRALTRIARGEVAAGLDELRPMVATDERAAAPHGIPPAEVGRRIQQAIARAGAWQEAIAFWTGLVAETRVGARAYFHRAEAKLGQGHAGEAREDAARGCALGHGPACNLRDRLAKQA